MRELLADERIVVVGLDWQPAAEYRFRVILEQGEEPLVLVVDQQWPVVADQLAGQAQGIERGEQNQAPVTQAVALETQPQLPAGGKRDVGGRLRPAHPAADQLQGGPPQPAARDG
ncbi:hypothetical protein D9M71_758410 [compost metagenome]